MDWSKVRGIQCATEHSDINISWRRRHGVSDSENAVRICNYLSKYMSKQLGQTPRELGKHRYRASKDIQPPRVRYLLDAQTIDKAARELVALIEEHGELRPTISREG